MEDEKKRKKNKKKKNKQNKAREDTAVVAEETASIDQNQSPEQDLAPSQVSEEAFATNNISGKPDGKNNDVLIPDAAKHGHGTNDHEALVVAETEKTLWLQRLASLEETVEHLQSEKDAHLRKETRLEVIVAELEHEKESLLLKQISMEGTISQLVSEKTSATKKQSGLEERIEQLLEDRAFLSSKHAEFEERIKHLEREKDLWASKEATLEERIKNLEIDKESWILKQSSTEGFVGRLRDDNARLQIQVKQLEESKIRISQENQMLSENISSLQAHADSEKQQNTEITMLTSQIEAASNLIEKLVAENADLVEKVNELYIELDRYRTSSETVSTHMPLLTKSAAIDDGAVLAGAQKFEESVSNDRTKLLQIYPRLAESNGVHEVKLDHAAATDAPIPINSGEIVQIPLSGSELQDAEGRKTAEEDEDSPAEGRQAAEENEDSPAEGRQAAEEDEDSPVELSDAPLTGAPIRFISFVARYVSGADLVSKRSANWRS
uniref:Uncharacterized protein n=1 Tax=Kalanchoe fedtschenkoi TaxID=63787 RepID=A0A7N0V8K8_KALFE